MYIVPKHKIAFIALPKNASRTVAETLKKIGGTTEGTGHHGIQPLSPIRNFFAFAVVRNPFSRTVSKWYDLFRHYEIGDHEFRKQTFYDYVDELKAGKAGCGFNKFHLSTQYYVIQEAQQHFDKPIKVITYENIEEDWKNLRFYNLVGKLRGDTGKHSGDDGYGDWRLYYDKPFIAKKVASVFAEDIQHFGYPDTV